MGSEMCIRDRAVTLHLQNVGAQNGMDPERLALIPTRLQEFVEEGQIAGAVMLLARHDGIVLLEAVGYQDLETKTPMRTDAIFRMASVAKPMTALGIMVLQEEGRLSVWDPVGRHLPELRDPQTEQASERRQSITLEQLLTHTSGMANESVLFEEDSSRRPWQMSLRPTRQSRWRPHPARDSYIAVRASTSWGA